MNFKTLVGIATATLVKGKDLYN